MKSISTSSKLQYPVDAAPKVRYEPIVIAIGVILCCGGIFLLLAAHQVLPHGINPMSQLGPWGEVCGYGALLLGLIFAFIPLVVKYGCKNNQITPQKEHFTANREYFLNPRAYENSGNTKG